jgi:phosphate transport system protein
MSVHFERELGKLKNKLLHLCAVVEDNLNRAVRALETRDVAMAEEVVEADRTIDNLEVEVEEDCLKILALHQPVAIDLRFIVTAMKINNDLERVGDLAVNIAERAIALGTDYPADLPIDFEAMAEVTKRMVKLSLDALINLDADLAREVCRMDDEVDEYNRRMFDVFDDVLGKQPDLAGTLLHLLSVSRHLERIADHATNIAEDVIYMVNGEIARHPSATGEHHSEER